MTETRTSPDAIEADIDEHRAKIDRTVDELKHRFSPDTLLDRGQDYLRGPGGKRLMRAVQENPLAAILTIAGAGWLLYTASRPEQVHPASSRRPYRGRPREEPLYDAPEPVSAARAPQAGMAPADLETPAARSGSTSATDAPASPATATGSPPSTYASSPAGAAATARGPAQAPSSDTAGTRTTGSIGASGSTSSSSFTGSTGSTGASGSAGSTGPSGSTAAAGSTGGLGSTSTAGIGGTSTTPGGSGTSGTVPGTGTGAKDAPGASKPGVMGDQTQEQRLNLTGKPGTRVTEDEAEEAFGRKPTGP
jgi:Protein of unknown function (DUF3618)